MADRAIINQAYVFPVLFVDGNAVPVTPLNPTITISYYNTLSVKVTLVTADLTPATPAEIGRYVYSYTIPSTFVDGDLLYLEMLATDPGTGNPLRISQTLALAAKPTTSGMSIRFVREG